MKPKVYVETAQMQCISPQPQWTSVNFYLPGTFGIANVRIRREVERTLSTHGYTKTTICTPEELI